MSTTKVFTNATGDPIALAAGNPTAGKSIFASHCAVCHSTQSGVTKIGPSLAGVVGSKSGLVPGFDFRPR